MEPITDEENIRLGYQASVDLLGILLQTSWSRFNAMVVANSIIAAMISAILGANIIDLSKGQTSQDPFLLLLAVTLAIGGIALTFFWQSQMDRDSEFQHYYMLSARHLERSLSPVKTLQWGSRLSNGCTVRNIDTPVRCFSCFPKCDDEKTRRGVNKRAELRLKNLGRRKISETITHTIWLFRGIYIVILAVAIIKFIESVFRINMNWAIYVVCLILAMSLFFAMRCLFSHKYVNSLDEEARLIPGTEDCVYKLELFKYLLDNGIISQGDYDSKKKEILSKM